MNNKRFTYVTIFRLTNPILGDANVIKAQEYLNKEDMGQHLRERISYDNEKGKTTNAPEDIELIKWELADNGYDGMITLTTTRELNEKELKYISEWVSGQNSDGLGEGFEQQDFADYYPCDRGECDDYNDRDQCGYGHCPYFEYSAFDWKTNDYIFEKY